MKLEVYSRARRKLLWSGEYPLLPRKGDIVSFDDETHEVREVWLALDDPGEPMMVVTTTEAFDE